MKRYFVIADYDTLRILNDPLRMQLLGLLIAQEATGKQLADLLHLSPSRVHYHLKELQQRNVVEIVRTQEKNGIVQKFFRAVAFDYLVDEALLPTLQMEPGLAQDILVTQLQMAIARIYATPDTSFPLFSADSGGLPLLSGSYEFKVGGDELRNWLQRYRQLLTELQTIETEFKKKVAEGLVDDPGHVFFLQNLGFLTPQEYFVSADQDLPDGYRWVNRGIVRKVASERPIVSSSNANDGEG
jgi:DNA-binding transcriptional ArsR family regulator